MMDFPTVANKGIQAVQFLLLGAAVHWFIVDPLFKKYQKQNEHDSAGPQPNQGALVPAPNANATAANANANANANAPIAIADGRSPRLIQKGIHVLISVIVYMTVEFPFFLLEFVSELAKVVPLQGIHGLWTALSFHCANTCRIIVLLGRDTSSFIGLVYQHPMAMLLVILLVVLCLGTYLGSFVLASRRALDARLKLPPVHETEEIYENTIVSSFCVVMGMMPFLTYFLILFLTVPKIRQLPLNMRRGAMIVSIVLVSSMCLPHLLTISWIERKSSYPFLLSLTDALMPGPLMESNHDFFNQYRQMYPGAMLILDAIHSALQNIFKTSYHCSLSLYKSMNSVFCCLLNYMFEVLVAGFSHYGATNVVLCAGALVVAPFFIFESIDLFIDLGTIMDWIFFQHSTGFFLVAIFYYVGVLHVAFLVPLYCAVRVHLSLPAFSDLPGSYVGDLLRLFPVAVFLFAVYLFYLMLVWQPCDAYLRRHFPFRQLNMPTSKKIATGIIEFVLRVNLYIFLFASTEFYICLVDAFTPGPLCETTSPITIWLRQHGVSSHFTDFFFE